MSKTTKHLLTGGITAALLISLALNTSTAAEKDKGKGRAKNPIEQAMEKYHKAPKGQDPVCKKASTGTASKEELAGMVKAYTAMCAAKPPQGDATSWKEKTGALLKAAQDLQAGKAGAVDAYKAAVNCKACHSVHRAD